MDYEKCLNEFEKYVNKYDLNINEIKYKYNHTLRVVEYAKIICKKEKKLNCDYTLVLVCSLLHDIARFEEWTKYNNWNEIDHGNLGYEILKRNNLIGNFTDNIEEQTIILNVVKFHNKFDIPESLSEKEKRILKVVRDADKLDILATIDEQIEFEKSSNDNWQDKNQVIIAEEIMEDIINERLLKNSLVNNQALLLIKQLTFLYDLNYRTSFKIIYKLNVVDKRLNILRKILINKEQYKIIEIKIKDYLESNIKL